MKDGQTLYEPDRDIAFMCDNFGDYQDLDIETMNVDLPSWMTCTSMEDRIAAMAVPVSMPGELELIAASKALAYPVFVLNTDNKVVQNCGRNHSICTVPAFQREHWALYL